MSTSIGIDNVVKKYGDMTIILDLFAFIKDGEFFILPGPSGRGKTALLRVVVGFNSIEGGTIQFDGGVTDDIPTQKRNIGMVFRNYAIFPHLTVRQSVEYGLRIRKAPKDQMRGRADEILRVVKIDEYQDHLSERLSGGQRQRMALIRAIVVHPQVLLMDESLFNLDAKLCIEMCNAIRDAQSQVGITTVYVAHNQEGALAISGRIAIMELGAIQQVGNLQDIYARPYNVFVSTFIDHSNLFSGTVKKQGSIPSAVFASGYHVEMPNLVDTVAKGQKVVISARPEESSLNPEGIEYEIISRTFLGKYTNHFLRFGEDMMLEDQPNIKYPQDLDHVDRVFRVEEKIYLRPSPSKINVSTQDMEQSLIKDMERYDE